METKHTPGPFKVERADYRYSERTLYQVRADDGSAEPVVCLVRDTHDGEISADEAEANALLFAAAPDTLAALEQMQEAYGRLHDFISDAIEEGRLTEADIPDDYAAFVEQLAEPCNAASEAAKAAIKRARGG